ncbi:MAG: CBS domain-containing protein [Thermodesulfovibrionales bacterium]
MPLFGELFLSDIMRKPVLDPKGEELGRLKDVSIIRGETLPKVDALVIERRKDFYKIPWSGLNIFNKRIMAATLYSDALIPYTYAEDDLLAVRDLLDKQIVDANGVKVVRVNDIKLEGYQADALLVAVDVGLRGILRRLGMERRGEEFLRLVRAHLPYNLISWNYIQPLQPKLSTIALTVPRQMVSDIHPADLAELISQVSHDEGAKFIENLDVETAAEALSELMPETQTAMLRDMDPQRAAGIIEEMPPDSAADVLGGLPAEKVQEIMEHLDAEEMEDLQELLGHAEDTAGGMMTIEFIAYPEATTVREAIARFRKDAPEIETVYYIYALDEGGRLAGVVSLRELLLSDPDARLSDIMEAKVKSVKPEEDESQVAGVISKYNLVALPVTDDEGALLGVVTVDDIVDRILPPKARRRRRKL